MYHRLALQRGVEDLSHALTNMIAAESGNNAQGRDIREIRRDLGLRYERLLSLVYRSSEKGAPESPQTPELQREVDRLRDTLHDQYNQLPSSSRPIGYGLLEEFRKVLQASALFWPRREHAAANRIEQYFSGNTRAPVPQKRSPHDMRGSVSPATQNRIDKYFRQ